MRSSCPALMRFLAMGLPMIPRPTKPTLPSATARLRSLEVQVTGAYVLPPLVLGQPLQALLAGVGGGLVLEAYPPLVGQLLQDAEDVAVVHLPGAGLAPVGRVGDLDVGDPVDVLPQGGDDVPLHALHVVGVVLELHVVASHGRREPGGRLG